MLAREASRRDLSTMSTGIAFSTSAGKLAALNPNAKAANAYAPGGCGRLCLHRGHRRGCFAPPRAASDAQRRLPREGLIKEARRRGPSAR